MSSLSSDECWKSDLFLDTTRLSQSVYVDEYFILTLECQALLKFTKTIKYTINVEMCVNININ